MSKIIILILIHAIGDFFFQGSKLSKSKASSIPYLLEHVGIYTLIFIILSPIVLGLTFVQGLVFSLLNGMAHFAIDYFTGKFKLKYNGQDSYPIVIGIDHTIHLVILISSFMYLFHSQLYTFPVIMNN